MPIYEYKCLDCETHLEKMLKVSDPPLTVCENCGGRLEKQWSLSGFQFKGEGWYVTDYAGKAATESGSAETKSDAKSEPAKTDAPKTSSGGESTASADGASKSETTTTSSDKSKP